MTPPATREALPAGPFLEYQQTVAVRFQEVDAMGVVWHGWYFSYFEEARVGLGRAHGIGYEDIAAQGLMAPVVRVGCSYFAPARFGDELQITARLYPRDAAKLEFAYFVRRRSDQTLLTVGNSLQVFTDLEGQLVLVQPAFLRELREQWKPHMRHDEQ